VFALIVGFKGKHVVFMTNAMKAETFVERLISILSKLLPRSAFVSWEQQAKYYLNSSNGWNFDNLHRMHKFHSFQPITKFHVRRGTATFGKLLRFQFSSLKSSASDECILLHLARNILQEVTAVDDDKMPVLNKRRSKKQENLCVLK
jgi:hypothetical protein